jgi:hypothetical protein
MGVAGLPEDELGPPFEDRLDRERRICRGSRDLPFSVEGEGSLAAEVEEEEAMTPSFFRRERSL